jgi:hypothetical protein
VRCQAPTSLTARAAKTGDNPGRQLYRKALTYDDENPCGRFLFEFSNEHEFSHSEPAGRSLFFLPAHWEELNEQRLADEVLTGLVKLHLNGSRKSGFRSKEDGRKNLRQRFSDEDGKFLKKKENLTQTTFAPYRSEDGPLSNTPRRAWSAMACGVSPSAKTWRVSARSNMEPSSPTPASADCAFPCTFCVVDGTLQGRFTWPTSNFRA